MGVRQESHGFSLMAVLVVLLVLVVLGSAGFYVYERQRGTTSQNNGNANSNSNQNSNTTTKSNQHTVKLPELGVQIALPDPLSDFTYVAADVDYSDSGNSSLGTYPTAYMGTKQLEALGCVATGKPGNAPPLGFLTKTTGQYPASPTADNSTGTLVKQFSDFYISYRASMACSQTQSTAQIQTTDVEQLKAALPSIELIQ